jgi:hypothetical protein
MSQPTKAQEAADALNREMIAELERQLASALKGKRPYSSAFADETIAAQVKRIAELEEKLNGWFSERGALRADVARLREVLQRIVSNGGSATNVMLFDARTALAQ